MDRIQAQWDHYQTVKVSAEYTPLERLAQEAKLGRAFIKHGKEILAILEAHAG